MGIGALDDKKGVFRFGTQDAVDLITDRIAGNKETLERITL
jgi:hypothetical protein